MLPEFVVGDEATSTLTVNYAQMSVVAIGAIQELKVENDALRARLDWLESPSSTSAISAQQSASVGAILGIPILAFAAVRRRVRTTKAG